jgi:hypothetical protein
MRDVEAVHSGPLFNSSNVVLACLVSQWFSLVVELGNAQWQHHCLCRCTCKSNAHTGQENAALALNQLAAILIAGLKSVLAPTLLRPQLRLEQCFITTASR